MLARIASFDDHTIEDWEYTLSVNVLGIVKSVKAFLQLVRKNAPDAHVVTHPESRPIVERRFQSTLDDYEFAGGSPS